MPSILNVSSTLKRYAPIIVIGLFGLVYLWIVAAYMGPRLPVSPDESQALFFSRNLAEQHSLIVHNPSNEQFSERIFASRQYVQRGSETMPSAFLGYVFLLGFMQFVHPLLLYAAGPAIAVACLVLVYKITARLLSRSIALVAVVLTGTFPAFVYWMASYYNNLAECCFVLAMVYFLIKAANDGGTGNYVLAGVFGAASIWMRYSNAALIPLSVLVYVWFKRKSIHWGKLAVAVAVVVLLLAPLVVINNRLYGSPLKFGQNTGDQLVYSLSDSSIPKEVLPFVPFRSASILIKNLSSYLYVFTPLLLILGSIGLIAAYKYKPRARAELALLCLLAASWLLYYMGGVYFGYGGDPLLSSSYTRYLLLVYLLLLVLFAYAVKLMLPHRLKQAVVVATVIISINIATGGLASLKAQSASSDRWLQTIEQATPSNAVLFVKGADKILYPTRDTALYLMLSKNESYKGEGIDRTVALMKEITAAKRPVYILKEDNFYTGDPTSAYLAKLDAHGLKVQQFSKDTGFYRIAAK